MAKKKIVFIDTNIFLACATAEINDSDIDVLEKIHSRLERDEMTLLLPEVIKEETYRKLEEAFGRFREASKIPDAVGANPEQKKDAKLKLLKEIQQDEIKKANEQVLKKIKEREDAANKLLSKIFKHKNTVEIALSDEVILSGLRRSALVMRPSSAANGDKAHHTKDIDCLAWESVLAGLKANEDFKSAALFICTRDSDYFGTSKDETIHKQISDDTKKHVGTVKGYSDLLKMLDAEFKIKYAKAQQDTFKAVSLSDMIGKPEALKSQSMWGDTLMDATRAFPDVYPQMYYDTDFGGLTIPATISRNARFCPFCATNIEFTIKKAETLGVYLTVSRNTIHCPHCAKPLIVV